MAVSKLNNSLDSADLGPGADIPYQLRFRQSVRAMGAISYAAPIHAVHVYSKLRIQPSAKHAYEHLAQIPLNILPSHDKHSQPKRSNSTQIIHIEPSLIIATPALSSFS